MINLLPPAGLPQPHEGNDARARREPGRDFAEWLLQTPKPGVAPAKDEALPTAAPAPVASPPADAPVVSEVASMSQTVGPELTPICFAPVASTPAPEVVQAAPEPAPINLPADMPVNVPTTPVATQPATPIDRSQAHPLRTAELPHALDPGTLLAEHPDAIHVLATHPDASGHVRPAMADDVILPWRLQANAGLSYLGEAAWVATSRSTEEAVAHAQGNNVLATAANLPEFGGPIAGNLRRGATPWTTYLADFSFGGVDREQRMERLSRYLAAHPDWKERLLRWVGSDADLTAWIRDFQLGEDDLGALVQKLREYAHEHGHALARVMHNGREVWRAANHESNQGSES